VNRLDPLAVPLRNTTLIEASAGTGKTWTLATLYLRLLVESQLQVGQILVVTYTNAATAELRDRIRRRLREAVAAFEHAADGGSAPADGAHATDGAATDPLRSLVEHCRAAGTLEPTRKHLATALRGFDEAAIFTIHGFCQRILLENAFESGVMFDAELVTDERPLCSEVVKDFWVRELHDAPAALIRHLQKKQSPDQLEKLARKVLASRDMPVLPEDAATLDRTGLKGAVDDWRGAVVAAHTIWASGGSEVARLLGAPATLNQQSYPAAKLAGWCAQLGAFLAQASDGSTAAFRYLDRFTTAKLADCTRKDRETPTHPLFAACDRVVEARDVLEDACKRHALRLQGELVRHVGAEVRKRHDAANTQSFDDLLYRLRDALRGTSGTMLAAQIRERFRAALIDEFQDTDPVQYEIFRRIYLGSDAPLFLIGDPKQAIYAFRGADVFTYVGAKEDAGANAYTLQVNHRSAAKLVAAVNTLFRRVRAPFVFDEIPFTEIAPATRTREALEGEAAARPPLEILYLSPADGARPGKETKDWANRNVPAVIAAEIVRLLESRATIGGRPLHAGDVAVLCRTNRQAIDGQRALRALGVPSVRQGDDSVFESAEAEEIERVLRAVAEPGDPRLLRAALATRLVGLDALALDDLQRDEAGWDDWAAHFREWLEAWSGQGFMAAFRSLLAVCATQRRLLALDDGERRLTNVLHLAELLQAASREAHRGPLALVDWLSLLRSDPAARAEFASEAAQVRLESDDKAVQLVTIHRSKGLEYGVVYCPYTWDGASLHGEDEQWVRFHDEADQRTLKLDLGSEAHAGHLERARLEAFAENLRLLYVAVTRARHRCTLVWSNVGGDQLTPLGYLLHQAQVSGSPAELVAATQAHLVSLGGRERLAHLDELERRSDGSITIRALSVPGPPPPALRTPAPSVTDLVLRHTERTLDVAWRVSSFSGLAASGGRTSHQAEEGIDHDATGAVDADEAARAAARAAERITLHDLPAGARTGELLHTILEHADFQRTDPADLGARVHDAIGQYGFEARWEAPIGQALDEALATPILAGSERFRLADVPVRKRFNELQFLFEVRSGFDKEALASCFARHPSENRGHDYPHRLERLGFPKLKGYLGGFIDLVFKHGGRWYVVDYKSNFLGPRPSSYAPVRLRQAMSLHHYYLQYHLYVLAVHRYLTLRLPGYDYARDFGGVAYLFLRGMAPRHEPGCGVFFDRPSSELLGDLSELVGAAQPGPAR